MPKAKETSLWDWLSRARRYYREELDIQRVENLVGSGTPDVEGFLQGRGSFWIELKALESPKSDDSNVNHQVSQDQISWLYNRWASGGKGWILFQFGSGAAAEKFLMYGEKVLRLQSPITYRELKLLSVTVSTLTPEEVIYAAATLRLSHPPKKSSNHSLF